MTFVLIDQSSVQQMFPNRDNICHSPLTDPLILWGNRVAREVNNKNKLTQAEGASGNRTTEEFPGRVESRMFDNTMLNVLVYS